MNRHRMNPTPTLSLPPAFAEAATRRQAKGEGDRYVPPLSRGRLGEGWEICRSRLIRML